MSSSNQPDAGQFDFMKQLLEQQQQQQLLQQQQQQQQPDLQAQLLSMLSGGNAGGGIHQVQQVAAPAAVAPAQLGQIMLSQYLTAQQAPPPQVAPVPPPVPVQQQQPNILSQLQSLTGIIPQQQSQAPTPTPLQPPQQQQNNLAQQQQLLASAQLLKAVNPGLAAAAMAQALTMINTTKNNNQNQQLPSQTPSSNVPLQQLQQAVGVVQQQQQQQQQPIAAAAAPQLSNVEPLAMENNNSNGNNNPKKLITAVSSGGSISASGASKDSSLSQQALSLPSRVASVDNQVINDGNKKKSKKQSHSSSSKKAPFQPQTSSSSSAGMGSLHSLASAAAAAAALHQNHHGTMSSSGSVGHHVVGTKPPPGPLVTNVPVSVMQRWSLDQLETHFKQLKEANQNVPQALNLLLADMRRKEEKRQAKRLANRKSASTSRARKKALIEEMTKDNARLRRQALILSFLPDPVVTISTDGIITFCSMQVERVLKHDITGLIGANIEDIIVPSSRDSMRRLIRDLIIAEQRATSSSVEDTESGGTNRAMSHEISGHSSERGHPPLLEVKVEGQEEVAKAEDVSDSSDDPDSKNGQGANKSSDMSSLTHKNSSFGPDSGEEPPPPKKVKISEANVKRPTNESDDSTTSAKKASLNLSKNVEMCKLNKDKEGAEQVRNEHKDDVMGASVTANNADAKLSSLMHHPNNKSSPEKKSGVEEKGPSIRRKHVLGPTKDKGKQEEQSASSADSSSRSENGKKRRGNSSEDSGYRESNESPEEGSSSSFSGESSESEEVSSSRKKKRKRSRARPIAPACKVRLIREDLSTIWCELTSSIRTKPIITPEESTASNSNSKGGKNGESNGSGNNIEASAESAASSESQEEEKELLLCFRPIREGETVGEELRFCPKVSESERTEGSSTDLKESSHSGSNPKSSDGPSSPQTAQQPDVRPLPPVNGAGSPTMKNRPPKKRKFSGDEAEQHQGSRKSSQDIPSDEEKSAVESMMELKKTQGPTSPV